MACIIGAPVEQSPHHAHASKSRSAHQNLPSLWPALCLAQKMGSRLGRRGVLLGALPAPPWPARSPPTRAQTVSTRQPAGATPADTVRLVLGDQLNPLHSWYRVVNPRVVYLLMEVREETDYVLHHAQKVLAVFAAMRAHAAALRQQG